MICDRRLLLLALGLGLGWLATARQPALAAARAEYRVVYLSREMVLADRLLQEEINQQAEDGWQYVDIIYGWRTDLDPPRSDPRYLLLKR